MDYLERLAVKITFVKREDVKPNGSTLNSGEKVLWIDESRFEL